MTVVYAGPDMAQEQDRRQNNRDKALVALVAAGPRGIDNLTLMTIAGTRAGARVQELRDRGYVIECRHEAGGRWRYVLHQGTAERVTLVDPDPPASGMLF